MGYDVHIERIANLELSEPVAITLDEWLAFVERDPEMKLTPVLEIVNPKTSEVIKLQGDGMATWAGCSKVDGRPIGLTFTYRSGTVLTRYPHGDVERIQKLHAIAREFRAVVRGDGGEIRNEAEVHGVGAVAVDMESCGQKNWDELFPPTFGKPTVSPNRTGGAQ